MKSKYTKYLLATIVVYVGVMVLFLGDMFSSDTVDQQTQDQLIVMDKKVLTDSDVISDDFVYKMTGTKKKKEVLESMQDITVETKEPAIGVKIIESKTTQQAQLQDVSVMTNKEIGSTSPEIETVFAAPGGDGSISRVKHLIQVIPHNTRLKAMLEESLSQESNHVVHATILEDVIIDGKRVALKNQTIIGQMRINTRTNRFELIFKKLFVDGIATTIMAVAVDHDGKRGLKADHIDKKHAQKLVNGVTDTLKAVVVGATADPLQAVAETGTNALVSPHPVDENYRLNKKVFTVLFDFPVKLKGV